MTNERLKKDFIKFLKDNPELRLWQALAIWSDADFIYWNRTLKSGKTVNEDTFYWNVKTKSDVNINLR